MCNQGLGLKVQYRIRSIINVFLLKTKETKTLELRQS